MRFGIRNLVAMTSLCLLSFTATAADIPLTNWTIPPYSRTTATQGGLTTMADATPGLGFVGFNPCRLVDTRQAGFPAGYGPPSLSGGSPRNFGLNAQPNCAGIPSGVAAYSLNVTVTNTAGPGFLLIYPQGTSQPNVSSLNYRAGDTVANAVIVPTGAGGGITVIAGVSGTDLIIDINGYFTGSYNVGIPFYVLGNVPGGAALHTQNSSNTNFSAGVSGNASGTGIVAGVRGDISSSAGSASAGVEGAAAASPNFVAGVRGDVASANTFSAGVYGVSSSAASSGGFFDNTGAGTLRSFLATRISAIDYGLYTDAAIRGGSLSITGVKSFVSPHPEDPSLEIKYASVEAPTVDVYFRGTARIVNGTARIEVPDHFRLTAREGTYTTSLTPIGSLATLTVFNESADGIVIWGSADVAFHYIVYAERDEVRNFQPIQRNVDFTPEALEKGGTLANLPETTRALLIRNGTLNPDGSYNRETARMLGWTFPDPPVPLPLAP